MVLLCLGLWGFGALALTHCLGFGVSVDSGLSLEVCACSQLQEPADGHCNKPSSARFQGYYIMEDYNVNPRITVSLSQETTARA